MLHSEYAAKQRQLLLWASQEPSQSDLKRLRGKGVFFDERIQIEEPVGSAFTDRVLEILGAAFPRRRKWKKVDFELHTLRVCAILANAMRARIFREIPAVLYYAKADAEAYADKPNWIRHGALDRTVKMLVKVGLLHRIAGKKMPASHNERSWVSSYLPTKSLMALADETGVKADVINWTGPTDKLVQLYEPKPDKYFDRFKGELVQPQRSSPIAFEPTPETIEWSEVLKAINSHYSEQEISIGGGGFKLRKWLSDYNASSERGGAPYRLPETFKSDLYRVFNNGSRDNPRFDEGGRLFGGWWMQVPEELRKAIHINGQPTIELDYKNCHPRMLYHQRGIEPQDDLYCLPEIEAYEQEIGKKAGTYRTGIKWLMQVLINGRGRPDVSDQASDILLPPDLTIAEIVRLIEAHHDPIADAFGTGAGLRLMRVESDIALEIISTAMQEGWTALSVHDSFITERDQKERLSALMIDSYTKRLGVEPVIK
ncbi:hypothetical protein [Erythrobacter aureus]|uniref:Uncharacterized protein n=1 Tax=Erythrobacter aureus TaxID=2182384 RepID=A0A345YD80_9SPHN|nr:hypothetical protein [Erythrobacter aureus]AXK41882.1 hypothetical protein DVR09_05580 [Erythrobacter aureus]